MSCQVRDSACRQPLYSRIRDGAASMQYSPATCIEAFGSEEWRQAADAFFQATGLALSVMDFQSGQCLYSSSRCSYCQLALGMFEQGPSSCFDMMPSASDYDRPTCASGLTTTTLPVRLDGECLAHVVVSGYVASTRDRKRFYEHLLARGTRESQARIAVRSMPVLTRRQVEAFTTLIATTAVGIVSRRASSSSDQEYLAEVLALGEASRDLMESGFPDTGAPERVLSHIMRFACAEAGELMLLRAGCVLEVVASRGADAHPVGRRIQMNDAVIARVTATARSVIAGGDANRGASVAVPLMTDDTLTGVAVLRLPVGHATPDARDVSLAERFARMGAVSLQANETWHGLQDAAEDLSQLNEYGVALASCTDLDLVSEIATKALRGSFSASVSALIVTAWGRDRASVVVSDEVNSAEIEMLLSEAAGRDITRQPLHVATHAVGDGLVCEGGTVRDDWATLICEVSSNRHTIGYLLLAERGGRYTGTDRRLLEGMAEHTAIALERSALFVRVRDDYAKTIAALSATMDVSERAPAGHTHRVMDYALLVGEEIGLTLEELEHLRFAGLLHDVGKTGVSEEILLKPSRLSAEEMREMQTHAELGATIIEQIDFLSAITPVVLHHHERWDGSGYPDGLAGQQIPRLARILAVADAFDAMTTDRTYRRGLSFPQARREMEAGAGTQFDPRMVAALLEALNRQILAGATGLFAPHPETGESLPA